MKKVIKQKRIQIYFPLRQSRKESVRNIRILRILKLVITRKKRMLKNQQDQTHLLWIMMKMIQPKKCKMIE